MSEKSKRKAKVKLRMKNRNERKKYKKTYRMRTLVTPSIWRSHVSVTIDGFSTTPPERLVTRICASSEPYTLNNGTVVVMRDPTRGIGILQVKVSTMAADAMELRGWR